MVTGVNRFTAGSWEMAVIEKPFGAKRISEEIDEQGRGATRSAHVQARPLHRTPEQAR